MNGLRRSILKLVRGRSQKTSPKLRKHHRKKKMVKKKRKVRKKRQKQKSQRSQKM